MSNIELDQKIAQIQKSTKTTVPQAVPMHDKMRMKYKWYYNWHIMPYSSSIHWGVFLTYFFFLIIAVNTILFSLQVRSSSPYNFSTFYVVGIISVIILIIFLIYRMKMIKKYLSNN